MGEIAKEVSLSQGTITGIVERLEKRSLVAKHRGLVDKRRVLLNITEEGKSLLATTPPLMQEAFADKFNFLSEWEQSMILSSLQRLAEIMDTGNPKVGK